MKRFWLFFGEEYYPAGGMGDFVGSYDSIEKAKNALPLETTYSSWAHIFDAKEGRVILNLYNRCWEEKRVWG